MLRVHVINSPLNPRPRSVDSSPCSSGWESCPLLFNMLRNVYKLKKNKKKTFSLRREADCFKSFGSLLEEPGLILSSTFLRKTFPELGVGALRNKHH